MFGKKEKTPYEFDKLVDDYHSCELRIAKRKGLIKEILLEIDKDERRKQQIIDIWQKEPKKK